METFHETSSRTLDASDSKQNIPFSFTVPPHTTQLMLILSFSPWRVEGHRNMLTPTLFDPNGWRGAGPRQGARHEVRINNAFATPGYLAGEIPAGTWTVFVDTHMIMPGVPLQMEIEVVGTDEPALENRQAFKIQETAPRGRGWYRGDLHAHTTHSDATWDAAELLAWAKENRLDFCTLSDHNTIAGLAVWDASSDDALLTISGSEVTTFWGHALALGVREWIDWRVRPTPRTQNERTMNQIAQAVDAQEGLFIIAHPRSAGDPDCTGCDWRFESMMPGSARVVEVWNENWTGHMAGNEGSLALAFEWLNQGYRLALTSGTDTHGPEHNKEAETFGFDVVYADELSERGILQAVRAGHLYMSAGPGLELSAEADVTTAMMGDVLDVADNAPIHVTAAWRNCPAGAQLALIVNGAAQETLGTQGEGLRTWDLRGGQANWCLVTVRDQDGVMLALTNPIFFDGRKNG